ncbi:MAG TPA: Npt1/Npt2 family nucleotide transporter [Candidatus Megaira endosymbiont of Nemacystus decipiens]|nr:Npt1/Npt2 family nucleotide transporter [Candidatus Megaera endosymbiont of Nemacystus decipiens]
MEEAKSSLHQNQNIVENTDQNSKLSFGQKILDYVWPISISELPKFLLITLLMFCVLCIQNLIRATKDSVISTMIGAETISFLKFWGVMPAAFIIMMLYVKIVNVMKGENIFYLVMTIFLSFFLIFAFYLFPNHEYLHLSPHKAEILVKKMPKLKWFILLLSKWSFSLFYIIAELWPNIVYSLLFWQFVNKITSIDESKRFYPLFSLLGQTGLYLSGTFLINLPSVNACVKNLLGLTCSTSVITVQSIIMVVTTLGLIGVCTFWIINNKILDIATAEKLQFKVKKNKVSFNESIKMVASSRYIRLITILLFCYGIAINLVEGPWKSEAAKIYKTPTEFASFVGGYLSYTGILTILFVLMGSNIVRRIGWIFAAIITPLMVLLTGLGFFMVASFDKVATFMMLHFAFTDPVLLAIVLGSIQNVLSKSSKYTLFDSTKEMSYVPLSDELKTKGKAAADMIGTKLGKSTSAFIQSTIFIVFPTATYSSISPYLMVIFLIICSIWIFSVLELNKEYKDACSKHGEEKYF